MAPDFPTPSELTKLSDREVLILTVQGLHDLRNDFETLAKEVRTRAPSPKEKKALWAGGVAGVISFLIAVGQELLGRS